MSNSVGTAVARGPFTIEENQALPADSLVSQIAHELRQPLSTIESIAYYLDMVLPRSESKARRQLAKLQQLVEQSNWILSNAVHLANPTTVVRQPLDLEEWITKTASESGLSAEGQVRFSFCDSLPLVPLDPGHTHDLLSNVFMLYHQVATAAHPVLVRTSTTDEEVVAEFLCTAPARGSGGISELPAGVSLSLASLRQQVVAQGGRLEFESEDGISIRIVFALR